MRTTVRTRCRDDRALTLVELMITIVVIGFVLAALAASLVVGLRTIGQAEGQVQANALHNEVLEELRALPWDLTGQYPDDAGYESSWTDPSGRTYHDIVTLDAADGSRNPTVPPVTETVVREDVEYTITRRIAWVDLGGNGDVDAKRLFSVVRWQIGDSRERESVRQADRLVAAGDVDDDDTPTVLSASVIGDQGKPIQLDATGHVADGHGYTVRVTFDRAIAPTNATLRFDYFNQSAGTITAYPGPCDTTPPQCATFTMDSTAEPEIFELHFDPDDLRAGGVTFANAAHDIMVRGSNAAGIGQTTVSVAHTGGPYNPTPGPSPSPTETGPTETESPSPSPTETASPSPTETATTAPAPQFLGAPAPDAGTLYVSKSTDQLDRDWVVVVHTRNLDPDLDSVSIGYRYWRESETSGRPSPPSQAAAASAVGQPWSCGGQPCQRWTATVSPGSSRWFDWRAGDLDITADATRTTDGQTANPQTLQATIVGVQ